jgi:hypothetical protein
MKRTTANIECILGRSTSRKLVLAAGFAATTFLALGARAEPAKAETPSTIGGGAVARVVPPAEKIKVLEDELAKEVERRGKAEEDNARRLTENNELVASAKILAKERASIEARLAETRDRETKVQRANDRLREENERIAVTVRLALPVVAVVCALILATLVWLFLFLRQVATRVHGERTLAEMHALEARLNHANDQYNAELKRNQTLRNKLAELGIVDEQSPHTQTGQWRTR